MNLENLICMCRHFGGHLLDYVWANVSFFFSFGRVGSRKDNWKLYPAVMQEMARVAKLNSGRACLLTQDKKCMFKVS